MKKLFALILAVLMVLGCVAVASAEQAQTLQLNWEEYAAEIEASEEAKATLAGDFSHHGGNRSEALHPRCLRADGTHRRGS